MKKLYSITIDLSNGQFHSRRYDINKITDKLIKFNGRFKTQIRKAELDISDIGVFKDTRIIYTLDKSKIPEHRETLFSILESVANAKMQEAEKLLEAVKEARAKGDNHE